MAVVRKFLFDNDFGEAPQSTRAAALGQGQRIGRRQAAPRPAAPPPPMFTEAEMQGACDIARRKGEEAGATRGRNEAVAAFDKQVAATLSDDRAADRGDRQEHGRGGAGGRQVGRAGAGDRAEAASRRWPRAQGLAEIEAVLGPVPGIAEAGAAPGRLCARRPARCAAGAAGAVVRRQRVRRPRRPDRRRRDGPRAIAASNGPTAASNARPAGSGGRSRKPWTRYVAAEGRDPK